MKQEVIELNTSYNLGTTTTELFLEVFEEKAEMMIRIAKAESGFKETAYNPEWHYNSKGEKVCQGSLGLLQIGCVHHDGDSTDLFDPRFNLETGKKVLEKQGFKAWGVCTNGLVNCLE